MHFAHHNSYRQIEVLLPLQIKKLFTLNYCLSSSLIKKLAQSNTKLLNISTNNSNANMLIPGPLCHNAFPINRIFIPFLIAESKWEVVYYFFQVQAIKA